MVYLRNNAETGLFITQWVDECIKFLSFVQMTDYQLMNPDYHKLFEQFLAKYDAQSRFDYGAYYTPKELADFVVRLTEQVVKCTFEESSIFASGNTIIDPCCGTGSFLEQILSHDPQDGEYNLCGFEILPAPYMLANYRLAVLQKQTGWKHHKSSILLANTLSNCVFGEPANEESIEGKELKRANALSSMPLTLIIGNPPSSDSLRLNSSEEFSIINGLMDDFRPPVAARRARQNIQKQVNNPHMQFLRWSCVKLLNSPTHSVLSLVLPLSFLEAESYRYARKFLAEQFSSAWIVSVDADARTGVRSDSLFHTLQGRAVVILTHAFGATNGLSRYHFCDLSHLNMDEKLHKLQESMGEVFPSFSEHLINPDTFAFSPAKPFNEAMYSKFWPVSGEEGQSAIFRRHCSGIKLAPTAIFSHVKAPMLKRRSKDIATGGAAIAHEWFSRQDRPPKDDKILAFQAALNNCGNTQSIESLLSNNIVKYSFRPFVLSNVLLWRDLLQKYAQIGGGGTRLRPEIISAYAQPDTIGFAMAHAPKDLNPTLSQFVSFCWYYPDNDMCTRGNSHIYLNQYPRADASTMENNVNSTLLANICELTGASSSEAARMVVFYSFAVLCSQVYLDEFEGALFTVNQSDKRARVPIVCDKGIFDNLWRMGEKLAELEKAGYSPDNVLNLDYDDIISRLPRGFHLQYSAHPFDEENEFLLLSDGRYTIQIPCPIALQKLNISGYDVIKNAWLKFYSYDFTHCELSSEDIIDLLNLLNRLTIHSSLVAQVDALVYQVLHNEVPLFLPEQ